MQNVAGVVQKVREQKEVDTGRGASVERSAVGFCLGSGLFGSYNSD